MLRISTTFLYAPRVDANGRAKSRTAHQPTVAYTYATSHANGAKASMLAATNRTSPLSTERTVTPSRAATAETVRTVLRP